MSFRSDDTSAGREAIPEAFGWWWADAVAALAMLPVIGWQGWETLEEARDEQSKLPTLARR